LWVEEKLMLWVENSVLNLLVKRVFNKKKIVVLLVINVDQKRFHKVSLIQWLKFSINSISINFAVETIDKLKNICFWII
jgi:hypothetical protein